MDRNVFNEHYFVGSFENNFCFFFFSFWATPNGRLWSKGEGWTSQSMIIYIFFWTLTKAVWPFKEHLIRDKKSLFLLEAEIDLLLQQANVGTCQWAAFGVWLDAYFLFLFSICCLGLVLLLVSLQALPSKCCSPGPRIWASIFLFLSAFHLWIGPFFPFEFASLACKLLPCVFIT